MPVSAADTESQKTTMPDMPEMMTHIPSERVRASAEWIHAHKHSTNNNLFGYNLYQFLRSAVAAAPYGLSMAGTWLAFEKAEKGLAKLASAERMGSATYYAKGFFANPVMRTGTMIGTSFSLYRATSKIGKWVNEYLFNPEDTLEQTEAKLEKLPEMLKEKCKEVYLPEFHSTLISSFVLGALVVHAKGLGDTPYYKEAAIKTRQLLGDKNFSFKMEGWKHFWKEEIFNPKSAFIPFAAMNSLGYSLFFELGDRRFKDKQISRGLWAGRSSSIGSSSKSNPSLLQAPLDNGSDNVTAFGEKRNVGELPEGSRMDDTLSVLTSEPSALRFLGRRFIPTAMGITTYAAIKMRGGYHFLGKFPDPEKMKTFSGFMTNAWREGANTSLFFVVPAITDKYAPWFDKAVNTLEAKVSGRSYDEVVAGHQPHATVVTPVAAHDAPEKRADLPAHS